MRLTCPQCGTEYDVPDEAVAGRARTLRCSFCSHQWRHATTPAADNTIEEFGEVALDTGAPFEAGASPEAEPIIDAPPLTSAEPAAYRPAEAREAVEGDRLVRPRQAPPPPLPRRRRAPLIIFVVLVVVVIVALAAHRPIARAYPETTRIYQSLGLR